MIYDAVLEVIYDSKEGLTSITSEFPDVKISLWCNWSIDILILDSDNAEQKNSIYENLNMYFGENMLLGPKTDRSPLIMRVCNCPSTTISTLLPKFDCFHIPPIVYEQNKEVLHVMIPSDSATVFDKIKENDKVKEINLKYLSPHKFPEKPFPLYLPINDLLTKLTDKQFEILKEAFNKGYYELPRQTTTEELSVNFDISRRALEDHLRKAERNIFNQLIPFFLMSRIDKI